MSASVVTSSQVMPTAPVQQSQIDARCLARSTTAAALSCSATTVSKKDRCLTCKPVCAQDAASTLAWPCTRCAMACSPRGPWYWA